MIYKYKLIKSLFSSDIANIIINYNIKMNCNKDVINSLNILISISIKENFRDYYFFIRSLKALGYETL